MGIDISGLEHHSLLDQCIRAEKITLVRRSKTDADPGSILQSKATSQTDLVCEKRQFRGKRFQELIFKIDDVIGPHP